MPFAEFGFEVGDGQALVDKEDKEVIDKVRSLVYHGGIVPVHSLDDRLHGFFSYFLGNFVRSLVEKFHRI